MAKTFTGKVVSTKMAKTIVIEVKRQRRHPLYKKIMRRSRHFKAHNEDNTIVVGTMVKIVETRPLSREKRFRVLEVVK